MDASMKKPFALPLFTLLLLLLITALTQGAQAQQSIELVAERSRLWIQGTSTVHDINCEAGKIVGYADLRSADLDEARNISDNNAGSVRLSIPVWEFDCGRRQMNRDFFRALDAESHPAIEFEYFSATLLTNLDPDCHPFQLEVEGRLSVSGNKRDVSLIVDIEPCEANHFKLMGSKTINMKDYGIEPPTALFGLVRAHEELTVNFSLTARQLNPEGSYADER